MVLKTILVFGLGIPPDETIVFEIIDDKFAILKTRKVHL